MTGPHLIHSRHVILVVDDDAQVLRTLSGILSRDGFEVLSAPDAAQALAIVEARLPCMILLDVQMPGMNGFELCRRLKSDPRTAHVPVVLVTARVDVADIEEGTAAGASDYIKKPFDQDDVRLRVRLQIRLNVALSAQRRDHQQLMAISGATNDAIVVIDNDGTISHWNPAAENIFGYARDEALGKNLHELLAPRRFHEAHRGAFPRYQATGEGAVVGKTLELSALKKSGEEFPIELSLAAARIDDKWCAVGIIRDITERKRLEKELREGEEKFRGLFETSRDALMTIEAPTWSFTDGNPATLAMFGAMDLVDFTSRGPGDLSPDMQPDGRSSAEKAKEMIETALREGSTFFEWTHKRIDGVEFPATILLTRMDLGGRQIVQATVRDISEQRHMEAELGHARKLEAVGQLAAGIAHEINTPTQYVGDSVNFLKEAFEGYRRLTSQYEHAVKALETVGGHEALVSEIHETEKDVDLPYLDANVPGSFDRCLDGISRIATIVRAMKEFAHPDQREKSPADLNQALQNTLIIAKNEFKYVADAETELGELPPVLCHVGDLNQVFLNLIVNAAHAIGDVVGKDGSKGKIRISTLREAEWARIDIADTGSGIPESIRQRIFEPFFTTKEVGKGSGQGLTIARSIVVNKHAGTLTFETELGKGTTFTIRLPIDGKGTDGRELPR